MYNIETVNNPNPIIENSFLESKFLNPDFLFGNMMDVFFAVFSEQTLDIIYTVFSVISIFLIAVIIYVTIRMFEIRAKEHAHLHHEIHEYAHHQAEEERKSKETGVFKNEKWKKILEHLFSINENDWRLSIIEADAMLFELLSTLGFKGESLGDKLKSADRETFHNLTSAWEVHNIRNKIAHEGSSFVISHHEAKRVIAIYEDIFKDFGYI